MIDIFFSGDFVPNIPSVDAPTEQDYKIIYGDMLPIIKGADYAITNLESPLIDEGTPIVKTGPNLKSPSRNIDVLKYAGFNLVTLANNHIMDYGVEGLKSTINVCAEYGIDYVGVGLNADEAKRTKYVELKGKTIAFINVCENEWSTTAGETAGANPMDLISLSYQIKEAKEKSDIVILIVHGGHEAYEFPSPQMKKTYRWFIDLGVDAVVGHHTHCYCGNEVYNEKPIFYSLGNFVFPKKQKKQDSWYEGCAVILHINEDGGEIGYELIPYSQFLPKEYGVHCYSGKEKVSFLESNKEKTRIINNDIILRDKFNSFISKKNYTNCLEPIQNKYLLFALNKSFLPSFYNRKKLIYILNIVRCESHREGFINSLKAKSKK